jgi:hypothetical protein
MAHRVFRLSISPQRAPEVRRVIDFDGVSTLDDVHRAIQRELDLDDDHLYAFYLSGRYFDPSSEHGPSNSSRYDSGRSVLFRLGLAPGRQFAYLFDFGDEHRHEIKVVSVTDVEAPLGRPVVVESVGEPPPQYGDVEGDDEPYQLPEHLTEVAALAETVLSLSERLDGLCDEYEAEPLLSEGDGDEDDEDEPVAPPEAILSLLRELSKAALQLADALGEDDQALGDLDEWSHERELLSRLLGLPLALVSVRELDSALAVARAFAFIAPESFNADIAIIFAESGRRDEAIAQLESNLKQYPESCLTAIKAGEAFEVLGDMAAAEDAYRRAMDLAEDDAEEDEALSQLIALLDDTGRSEESRALLAASTDVEPRVEAMPRVDVKFAPVGRNEPCPCGSGKKYKKCHGA